MKGPCMSLTLYLQISLAVGVLMFSIKAFQAKDPLFFLVEKFDNFRSETDCRLIFYTLGVMISFLLNGLVWPFILLWILFTFGKRVLSVIKK